MAQLKAHEADRFLAKPDMGYAVFLVYGPDHGLVAERASVLAQCSGVALDDAFSAIRLDADALASDPDRLMNEAYTVAMFGGRRLIWMRNVPGDRATIAQVERLLADPPEETMVLIEAGDLKKGGLRALVERAQNGMAIPCYADNDRSIQQLIDQTFSENGRNLELDARRFLTSQLGGDRAATRTELDKVLLYTLGEQQVTLEAVRNICGDASALGYDDITDAVITGNLDDFDHAMNKFESGGGNPSFLFASVIRQFQTLDRMRNEMDKSGKNSATVIAQAKPPVFFARRAAVERALAAWTGPAIRAALERLRNASFDARRLRAVDVALLRMTLMALTIQSARRSANRRA